MICLIQRSLNGKVDIAGKTVGAIEKGMVVLVGFQPQDNPAVLEKMAHKLLHYRLFADENQKMNLNVQQVNGGILLVPQFTLAADTQSGLRPSFSSCAPPAEAEQLFRQFMELITSRYDLVASGIFGADMQVSLTNDGPVTFWLQT
ncbi:MULTISPECIES: D-aminoacyl-tRNA deacylase [Thiomicrorhabdus]|uniref:D-aminoacyl-tRNA deacylase n=1 Tax=Thiomicrorhabdus heinhorstiae TaxID=2748010 RepID=A0ABS0BUI6_9GAMM|nr:MULTISPECIES: D-aminoacyl-tRNA deacylase [Thiomicrorhabdus]MBF6057469.1 D-tyrosyl-tRNA(Tyr) deacylase [Thiomicrorhabdus heinhorstiae]